MHPCFWRIMWLWWLHQNVTFSTRWIGLQPSVKLPGMRVSTFKSDPMVLCRKAPPPWGWEWVAASSKEAQVSCSWVRVYEIDKWIGTASKVMWALSQTIVVKREQSLEPELLSYQLSYVPTLTYSDELWVVTEKVSYKRLKWVSSVWWLGSALEIGWGAQTSRGSLEYSHCPLASKVASWGCSGIWLEYPMDASLWKFSGNVLLKGDPRSDPELAGEIMYLIRPGNTSGSPRRSWKELSGRRTLGMPCSVCWHRDPTQDKQKKRMDGWMDVSSSSALEILVSDLEIPSPRLVKVLSRTVCHFLPPSYLKPGFQEWSNCWLATPPYSLS